MSVITVELHCLSASCSGSATLSVARNHGWHSYTHIAVARDGFTMSAGQSETLRLRLTSFGKRDLVRAKRVRRFHVTLLTRLISGQRAVSPIYLR
jgi:hypothetical protein